MSINVDYVKLKKKNNCSQPEAIETNWINV
jgi:hypothetical protein